MELTEDQLRVKVVWQANEIERLTNEATRLRDALADRQILTGELSLKSPDVTDDDGEDTPDA